jgi:GNAT superfamily N-acetyltransferase
MSETGLVKITGPLIQAAAITLAEAFFNDPYAVYLIPDPRKRANLRYGFEYYLRTSMRAGGELFTTSKNVEGVAIWQDSRKTPPWWLYLGGGNPWLPLRCGLRYIIGDFRAERQCAKIKKAYAPAQHLYLALFGVQPKYQGQGYGSRLLWPILKRLDETRTPCYLETETPKNVELYRHFGFKVVHETLFDKKVPFYAMLREQ